MKERFDQAQRCVCCCQAQGLAMNGLCAAQGVFKLPRLLNMKRLERLEFGTFFELHQGRANLVNGLFILPFGLLSNIARNDVFNRSFSALNLRMTLRPF